MNTTERQILSSLDQQHRELVGVKPCRWHYAGMTDTYSCQHLELPGKAVIGRVEGMNRYPKAEE
jgi:hypothetical protein